MEKAKKDWHYYNIFDLSSPIIQIVVDKMSEIKKGYEKEIISFKKPVSPEVVEEYNALVRQRDDATKEIRKLLDLHQIKNQESLDIKIEEAISSSQTLNEEEKNILINRLDEEFLDLSYYIKHKEFRRLSDWLSNV